MSVTHEWISHDNPSEKQWEQITDVTSLDSASQISGMSAPTKLLWRDVPRWLKVTTAVLFGGGTSLMAAPLLAPDNAAQVRVFQDKSDGFPGIDISPQMYKSELQLGEVSSDRKNLKKIRLHVYTSQEPNFDTGNTITTITDLLALSQKILGESYVGGDTYQLTMRYGFLPNEAVDRNNYTLGPDGITRAQGHNYLPVDILTQGQMVGDTLATFIAGQRRLYKEIGVQDPPELSALYLGLIYATAQTGYDLLPPEVDDWIDESTYMKLCKGLASE